MNFGQQTAVQLGHANNHYMAGWRRAILYSSFFSFLAVVTMWIATLFCGLSARVDVVRRDLPESQAFHCSGCLLWISNGSIISVMEWEEGSETARMEVTTFPVLNSPVLQDIA